MKRYRDGAADNVSTASRRLERLIDRINNGQFTRAGLLKELHAIQTLQQKALRHLEKAGADTEPD